MRLDKFEIWEHDNWSLQGSLKNNKKLSQFKCVLPERATFWGYTSELAAND